MKAEITSYKPTMKQYTGYKKLAQSVNLWQQKLWKTLDRQKNGQTPYYIPFYRGYIKTDLEICFHIMLFTLN